MEEIILYSTGCPRCNVLKSKLNASGIQYKEERSVDVMQKIGLTEVPAMLVNGKLLNFIECVRWINNH